MKGLTGFMCVAVIVTWAVIDFASLEAVSVTLFEKFTQLVPTLFEAFAKMVQSIADVISSEVADS